MSIRSIVRNSFAAMTLIASANACAPEATDNSARDQAEILNGTDASIASYPFIVSISYSFTVDNHKGLRSVGCAGAIVSPSYVLTAAHCVEGSPNDRWLKANQPESNVSPYLIQAGSRDARRIFGEDKEDVQNGNIQKRYVDAIIMHPDYSSFSAYVPRSGTPNADLALLHLVRPLELKEGRIQVAEIGSASDVGAQDSVFAVGWGTDKELTAHNYLDEHRVRLLDPAQIPDEKFDWARFTDSVPFLSVKDDTTNVIYYGDSGGPLVRRARNQTSVIGVLSHMATVGQPLSIAADLSQYKTWIQEQIGKAPPSANTEVVTLGGFKPYTGAEPCTVTTCFASDPFTIPEGAKLMSTYFELETATDKPNGAFAYAYHETFDSSTYDRSKYDANTRYVTGETPLYSVNSNYTENGYALYGESTVAKPRAGQWRIVVECQDDCSDIDFENSQGITSYDTIQVQ